MGANVELDVLLRKNGFSIHEVFAFFERAGVFVSIQEMSMFDDWKYTNEAVVQWDSMELNQRNLFLEKFTRILFYVNNTWRCVLLTSLEDEVFMNLSFGLDLDTIPQIRWETIDEDVGALFDKITTMIDEAMGSPVFQDRFFAASMGIEYSVAFNPDVLTMLQDDNGAQRWILPKRLGKEITLKQFFKEEKRHTFVLSRK